MKDDALRLLGCSVGGFIAGYALRALLAPPPARGSTDTVTWPSSEEYKMVLVVRMDLPMTKGKIAAQCCHATLACYKYAAKAKAATLKMWEDGGQAKITLKCRDEAELLALEDAARRMGLCAKSICDAGRTQIEAGSRTVLAIGPGPVAAVDAVTGHLKLY